MENISFRILRICIFVFSTVVELQTAQLLSVPEPCPDIAHSTTIADMCTTDFANEEPRNGGVTADSVALRVMTQQNGCTCEVSLQNQTKIYTVYMRKYDLRTSAVPEQKACGLAIEIVYTSPENFPENKTSIECTKGTNTRSVSLSQNGVLNLKSRIIGGNFSRGYCIQIYRHHITGDDVGIQINCSHPNIQTTQQDKTVSNMQNVQLQTVPNPCPDIAPQSTIVDMCTSDYATEEDKTGGTTVDSVALRIMTQKNGCTCEVKIENQKKTYTLYMRKYDLVTTAAPEEEACGLAIDIEYNIPNNLPETTDPVECTKGTGGRSISLSQNGVLNLRSRSINGTFTRGYCMQIFRQNQLNYEQRVEIHCSNATKSQQMTEETNTDFTLYIAIGIGSAVVVIALFVVVAIIIIRRKVKNKNKDGTKVQPDIDCADYDSDGLKYNTLYNSSEQQDAMEGDYHTVDGEGNQNRNGIQNLGSDYNAVDGNYSSIDIINMPVKDGPKTNNEIKSTSTTTPRSETQRIEEETSNDLKHVTPMDNSNVEYAVVDKSVISDKKVKHVTAPNDSSVEYAVIDKNLQI